MGDCNMKIQTGNKSGKLSKPKFEELFKIAGRRLSLQGDILDVAVDCITYDEDNEAKTGFRITLTREEIIELYNYTNKVK
jgi:hypothetical protein